MNESPWHLRQPSVQQQHWYQNLKEIHHLTQLWWQELQSQKPDYCLSRGIIPCSNTQSSDAEISFEMIHQMLSKDNMYFLDDAPISSTLLQLEKTLCSIQSWVLNTFLQNLDPNQSLQNLSFLETLAWQAGNQCMNQRWNVHKNLSAMDLSKIAFYLKDIPLKGNPLYSPFLIKRATHQELQIELYYCPHTQNLPETQAVADQLCQLHSYWTKGFLHPLNPAIYLNLSRTSNRCLQHWSLLPPHTSHESTQ